MKKFKILKIQFFRKFNKLMKMKKEFSNKNKGN